MISRRRLLQDGATTLLLAQPTVSRALLAGPHTSYDAQVLALGPVAFWRFDDHAQGAVDQSGHGHVGTYHGGVGFDPGGAIRGPLDDSIELNGVDAYVEIADSIEFSQPSSNRGLTVEAWFRPDALTFSGETSQHYVHWLGKGENGQIEWGFRFYSKESPRPNRVSAYVWNARGAPGEHNEGAGAYVEDPLSPGTWTHIVACFDPGDARNPRAGVSIFRDGVFRAGPAKSRGARYASYGIYPMHGSAPLRLGTRDRHSFLRGGLDAVAIYPRVLRPQEIRDNYRAARAPASA